MRENMSEEYSYYYIIEEYNIKVYTYSMYLYKM